MSSEGIEVNIFAQICLILKTKFGDDSILHLSQDSFVRDLSRNSEIRTGSGANHHFGTGSSSKYQISLEKWKSMMGLGVIIFGLFVKNPLSSSSILSALLTDQLIGFNCIGHNSQLNWSNFYRTWKRKEGTKIKSSYSLFDDIVTSVRRRSILASLFCLTTL